MKKNLLRVVACAVVMTMSLSLFACSKDEDKDTKSKTEESSKTEDADDDSSDKEFASIEEYVNSDIMQAEINSMLDSVQEQGMKMEVKGEGNKLIYSYTYTEMENEDGMKEALEAGLDSQKGTFVSVAQSLETIVDVENPVVVVEYIDANGTVIASREFAADDDVTSEDEDSAITGKFATMDEYVNSDLVQSQLESMMSSMEGQGMTMEIKGDGNKLIYTYRYDELAKEDGMAETLQAGLEAEAATFKSVASSLSLAVEVENPVVVVEYIDMNGEVIYSQEFTAE